MKMDIQAIVESLMQAHTHSCTAEKPQYKCDACHDTGWVEADPVTRAVRKCECMKAREAEERMKRSGLEQALSVQTFDTFVTKTALQKKLYDTGKAYLDSVLHDADNPRRPWLYIGGNPGSGKTHICTAICGELLKNNIGVRYMQWLDESRRLKASVNDEDFEDYVSDYINVPVLYVDDLMKQKYTKYPTFTEADIKIAFTILNARYLQNKPTIISSEWDLIDQLLSADEGVFSRVYERCKGFTVTIDRNPANNYRLSA